MQSAVFSDTVVPQTGSTMYFQPKTPLGQTMTKNVIRRVVPNIPSNCLEESVVFYTEYLGFRVAMDMGWIVTVVSPGCLTAQISIVRGEPSHGLNVHHAEH